MGDAAPATNGQPSDERNLVLRVLRSDRSAFDALYRKYFPRLTALITARTGDRNLAEDVAQEALTKALHNLDKFDVDRQLWPWLKTIAINLSIDHLRRGRREIVGVTVEGPHNEVPLFDEEAPLLKEAMSGLPARQRVALSLRYIQDWEPAEAASFLGIKRSAFEQLLFRARRKLRDEYHRIAGEAVAVLGLSRRFLSKLEFRFGRRLQRSREWLVRASQLGEVTIAQVAGAALATAIALPAVAPGLVQAHGPHVHRKDRHVAEATVGRDRPSASNPTRLASASGGGAPTRVAPGHQRSSGGARGIVAELGREVTDPNHDVKQPEDASITSIATDPDGGPSMFAAGVAPCVVQTCERVLFRSDDRGASWKRVPGLGFAGSSLAIAPGADSPARVFAMTATGLQVSDDNGRTFHTAAEEASPLAVGPFAISPAFAADDPTVLIGGQSLMSYRDTDRRILPEMTTALRGPFEPAYAPGYPADPRFVLGALRLDSDGWRSSVYTCRKAQGCTWRDLPFGKQRPSVRIESGTPEGIFAFTEQNLFYSANERAGFYAIKGPWEDAELQDLSVDGGGRLIAAVHNNSPHVKGAGVYISNDAGASWTRVADPLLDAGAMKVLSMAGGRRIIAALPSGGVACSSDRGITWSQRCSR